MRYFFLLAVMISNWCFADLPKRLVCTAYGSSNFWPESSSGKYIDTILNTEDERSTVNINFEEKLVTYEMDGKIVNEALNPSKQGIFTISGIEEGKEYFGAYSFNKDHTHASYTSDGEFAEFFICKRSRK